MKRCQNCGTDIEENVKICPICSSEIDEEYVDLYSVYKEAVEKQMNKEKNSEMIFKKGSSYDEDVLFKKESDDGFIKKRK